MRERSRLHVQGMYTNSCSGTEVYDIVYHMKNFALLSNFTLLGLVIWIILDAGMGTDLAELFIVGVFLITPVVSVWALMKLKGDSKNWFALWLKRKTLEEEVKINKMKK